MPFPRRTERARPAPVIRTRFAPSPNGRLHMGHAFAAIVAHDLARMAGGRFQLRIEDIDGLRSREDFVTDILADLEWLGLEWDGPVVRQSAHLSRFTDAGARLRAMGLLYPCTCTRAEIAAAITGRGARSGPDGPVYPGTCRHRDVDVAGLDPAHVAWRIDMARACRIAGPLEWVDQRAGPQIATPEIFGDIVLLRKDLPASYHLAATLDDAHDAITCVTRGMDLFRASHVHRLLQALLGLPVPVWHHHGLLVEGDGRKLAKRRGSPSLADRRHAGEDGRALARALRRGHFPDGLRLSEEAAGPGPAP